jgi:hypothetical protein
MLHCRRTDPSLAFPWVFGESSENLCLIAGIGNEQDADTTAFGSCDRTGGNNEPVSGEAGHESGVVTGEGLIERPASLCPCRPGLSMYRKQAHVARSLL